MNGNPEVLRIRTIPGDKRCLYRLAKRVDVLTVNPGCCVCPRSWLFHTSEVARARMRDDYGNPVVNEERELELVELDSVIQLLVELMRNDAEAQELHPQNLEAHLKALQSRDEWPGQLELKILARAAHRNVQIFSFPDHDTTRDMVNLEGQLLAGPAGQE